VTIELTLDEVTTLLAALTESIVGYDVALAKAVGDRRTRFERERSKLVELRAKLSCARK
jgi:hypothetical protein